MGFNLTVPTKGIGSVLTATETNTYLVAGLNGIQSAWTSWTPTVASGLTVGNGTWTGGYLQVGKDIQARFSFTFGSTSAFTTPLLLFPVPINTSAIVLHGVGGALCSDASAGVTGRYAASLFVNNATTGGFGSFGAVSSGNVALGNPFVWATGDILSGTLLYEAA